ncbi:MAG: amidohydrolase family protein, partial [Rhodospirillaceae bacterium]|nr:amidohydrolase family protein [Rhodospirillaceae bacterium]
PFHPNPSKPTFTPPAGAVDAHCHVFGPADEFPYAPERKYTPCDASKTQLFALRDHLGFARNVIVQATCHGKNNDAMVDALNGAGDMARGVAMIGSETTDDELKRMDEAGVRAARFNFLKRLVGDTPKEVYVAAAERIAELGWHNVVYFEANELEELTPFLTSLPGIVVVDHMGRPDASKPLDDPDFQRFLTLMDKHENFWVKVSCPERLTIDGPPYDDVVPFARELVDRFTDRVLWGTDWPHPNMKSHVPDEGQLVDVIPKIATDAAKQQALLVDNPMRLYWG